MQTKTEIGLTRQANDAPQRSQESRELLELFEEQISVDRISWTTSLRLLDVKGQGSQGTVFKAERRGADGFRIPLAVKYFSPEIFASAAQYDEAMKTVGAVASVVATIQHENLVVVNHFLNHHRVRMMAMEWIDGFDLRQLLTAKMYGRMKERCSRRRWEQLHKTLFDSGPVQPKLRVGAVMAIMVDCLSALSALHEEGVLHNDIKPSNVMLNRSGRAKIVDIGSATEIGSRTLKTITPAYCAPELLANGTSASECSDIASVGYMAVEMLIGEPIFSAGHRKNLLRLEKESFPVRLETILDEVLHDNRKMVEILKQMTAIPIEQRIQSAAEVLEHLRKGPEQNFAVEAARDGIRIWIDELLNCEF